MGSIRPEHLDKSGADRSVTVDLLVREEPAEEEEEDNEQDDDETDEEEDGNDAGYYE